MFAIIEKTLLDGQMTDCTVYKTYKTENWDEVVADFKAIAPKKNWVWTSETAIYRLDQATKIVTSRYVTTIPDPM